MRLLAYIWSSYKHNRRLLHMAESRTIDAMYKLCRAAVAVFVPTYLRALNEADTARILTQNVARGFPGMLKSIDCMHQL
jgi:hypothetical protein